MAPKKNLRACLQLLGQPRLGERPVALHGFLRSIHQRGDFLNLQASEHAQLHYFRFARIYRGQFVECFAYPQTFLVVLGNGEIKRIGA